MKQKYFVLIFLNFILVGSVISQENYSNEGKLKIESGTDFTIAETGHKFRNYSSGDIQNEGTLNVSDGSFRNDGIVLNDGTINFGSSTNYLTITNNVTINTKGSFSNESAGTFTNNGSLFLQGDYMNDGTVDPSTGTTTFNQRDTSPSETIQNMYGTSDFEFYNLVVNNNTSLGVLVDDGIGLLVTNDLYLQEGNLRLEGESQLIQPVGSVVNTSGTGVLLRDQQGIASTYGYNYWSSPVNNGSGSYSLNNVLYDGTDSSLNPFSPTPIQYTTGSGGNGSPSIVDGSGNVTTAATVNSLALFSFINGVTNDFDDWIKINESTLRLPGEGYTMKGTNTEAANQNYSFVGQPNNGTYSFSIVENHSTLFGNPYPSSLDTFLFILLNTPIGQLYFWADGGSTSHELSEYLGGYATRSFFAGAKPSIIPGGIAGGGTAPDLPAPGKYVAVGQGFFIEAQSTGTITFTNEYRSFQIEEGNDGINGSNFYKNSNQKKIAEKDVEVAGKEDLSDKSIIRIGYEDPEGFHRELVLGFLPKSSADKSFNRGFDAVVSGPREDDLFFIIENEPENKYVIQGVGEFNEDDVFPLSLAIAEEGVHTIMLDAVEDFDGQVYIFDKDLGVTYNISEESFSPNLSIGQYNNRFEVVFKQQTSLGTDDEIIKNFNVYFDGGQNLIVKNRNNLAINKLSVFNTLGQELLAVNNNKLEQSQTIIPFSYQMGVYIIVVETNEGKETFRIINK